MKIEFYNNLSEENVVNKELEKLYILNMNLKEETNIIYPTLILSGYNGGNYCYIEDLKRYYYISSIRLLHNKTYELQLEVDVLNTYKNDIMKNEKFSDGITRIYNKLDNDSLQSKNFILIVGD